MDLETPDTTKRTRHLGGLVWTVDNIFTIRVEVALNGKEKRCHI